METPETAEPTDVSETGYTAQWLPVERAMGYAVRHYLRHTALEDEMYNLVHEDLETITDGTLDWPAYFYDENLDKYSNAIVNSFIACFASVYSICALLLVLISDNTTDKPFYLFLQAREF